MKLHRIFALVSLAVVTPLFGQDIFDQLADDQPLVSISVKAPEAPYPGPYPRVAKLARVQGIVNYRVVLKDGAVESLTYQSGPAILAIGVKEWKFDESLSGEYSLSMQYVLIGGGYATKLVRHDKGDALDRWVLKHVFRAKTYKMVLESYCDSGGEQKVEAKRAVNDNIIKIRVEAPEQCLMVEASYLASR